MHRTALLKWLTIKRLLSGLRQTKTGYTYVQAVLSDVRANLSRSLTAELTQRPTSAIGNAVHCLFNQETSKPDSIVKLVNLIAINRVRGDETFEINITSVECPKRFFLLRQFESFIFRLNVLTFSLNRAHCNLSLLIDFRVVNSQRYFQCTPVSRGDQ